MTAAATIAEALSDLDRRTYQEPAAVLALVLSMDAEALMRARGVDMEALLRKKYRYFLTSRAKMIAAYGSGSPEKRKYYEDQFVQWIDRYIRKGYLPRRARRSRL